MGGAWYAGTAEARNGLQLEALRPHKKAYEAVMKWLRNQEEEKKAA